MHWSADVHAGVVQNEILEMDEFAGEPDAVAGVRKMRSGDPALPDRALGQPLVEPGDRILSCCEGRRHNIPRDRFGSPNVDHLII